MVKVLHRIKYKTKKKSEKWILEKIFQIDEQFCF